MSGSATRNDRAIWDHALATGAVIISKDEDFTRRKALGNGGPAIVWIRLPNTRRHELLVWFESVLPEMLEALERGESLIEVI